MLYSGLNYNITGINLIKKCDVSIQHCPRNFNTVKAKQSTEFLDLLLLGITWSPTYQKFIPAIPPRLYYLTILNI
jgi:hypothetical protein